jgi:hypothetical protein
MAPLRHNGFRLLASGRLTSDLGDACFAVALPCAIIPMLVRADQLQAANSLAFGGTQLATLVGPALGGISSLWRGRCRPSRRRRSRSPSRSANDRGGTSAPRTGGRLRDSGRRAMQLRP